MPLRVKGTIYFFNRHFKSVGLSSFLSPVAIYKKIIPALNSEINSFTVLYIYTWYKRAYNSMCQISIKHKPKTIVVIENRGARPSRATVSEAAGLTKAGL